jgi:5'-nucleotidase
VRILIADDDGIHSPGIAALERDEPSPVHVNLPPRPRGMRWTRQAVDRYDGRVVPDTHAVADGLVSLTPLRLDLTDHAALAAAPAEAGPATALAR